jgi:Ca2+-transporting ATPase
MGRPGDTLVFEAGWRADDRHGRIRLMSPSSHGPPWAETSDEVLQHLDSRASGLAAAEVAARLAEHGPNEIAAAQTRRAWHIFGAQLRSALVLLLIVAAAVSLLLADYLDAVAILAIVGLNAALGFGQEYRAERAVDALRRLAVPPVRVRRDGRVHEAPARDLVPGDIVLLEAGNIVPADGRLLLGATLRVSEAALTGESEPVDKDAEQTLDDGVPLADRHNMVYSGTSVAYGRGELAVTATGMGTELGAVAHLIGNVREPSTPLQRRLDRLARQLSAIALGLVAVIFFLGILRGEDARLMFLTGVSIAVAAVPEGLPAVVTVSLALGAQRMLARNALIRRLSAVETLGSVTVICTDKTGTLTANQMALTVLDVAGGRVDLTERFPEWPKPHLAPGDAEALLEDVPALAMLLAGAALCNDARLQPGETGSGSHRVAGDPTERALVVAAAQLGLDKRLLEARYPRVAEVPFDAQRRQMTTVHDVALADDRAGGVDPSGWTLPGIPDARHVAFVKGAADGLVERCSGVWVGGVTEPLTDPWRRRIEAAAEGLAREGMRVLGVAFCPLVDPPTGGQDERLGSDLVFIGLAGLIDPARPEAKEAVARCRAAGIRPVMVTGDHPLTAWSIARDLSIAAGGELRTGADLAGRSVDELVADVDRVAVFARVSPEQKLRIVEALQTRGQVVAMTGDGVNDAPALKKAEIGVVMGQVGTDVAREAADMVLLDDNFATIVAAVEEGRVIRDNVRKFVLYLMTSNSAEIWVMLAAPLVGMPLPLLPLQILWINLMTDGPPALALGFEPGEPGVMARPPDPPGTRILSPAAVRHVIAIGLWMAVLSLGVGYAYWFMGQSTWRTMIFTTLTFAQLGNVLALRSGIVTPFRPQMLPRRPLLGAVAGTFALQLAAIYLTPLSKLLHTEPLPAQDLMLTLALAALVFGAVELSVRRGRHGS